MDSFEEKLKREAAKSSISGPKRQSFRDGANWAKQELGSDHSYLEGVKSELKSSKQKSEIAVLEERIRLGWQPIETAPKDGTQVLMKYQSKGSEHYYLNVCAWVSKLDSWVDTSYACIPEVYHTATHWMPIPEPPKEELDD